MVMNEQRLRTLNKKCCRQDGSYVLYWMQESQRAEFNPALEYAARQANERELGLVVGFCLWDAYPDANARHFAFMLEGLAEVRERLHERGIKFVVRRGPPEEVALGLAADAALVVCDRGYLRHQRRWYTRMAQEAGCRVVQVEGDVVVPVETVSNKAEYAARTIRKKINQQVPHFLENMLAVKLESSSLPLEVTGDVDVRRIDSVLEALDIDHSVPRSRRFAGGNAAARKRLTSFLRSGLSGYADARNDPSDPQCSTLSPYLHFGQISPVEIARKVSAAKGGSDDDKEAFLEELIVRRELAVNFVFHTDEYDSFSCLPDWAKKTLAEHEDDERPARYTRKQLEHADTGDDYWNAAMQEMRKTGYMHNYMRMYWGKKILEWCNTPQYAYETTLYLNNKYFLDGRDANSYAAVAWVFGLHDRPWQEREVFGKLITMTAGGLERTFDIDAYVR
ncbi:MAG: deoxyribodipyrimidine photolyase, partial [Gammaproteobacteria bacterium]|nr:deoxyribodipyrimidine photolyase [Gammaproteobacteria bacterium]